MNKFIKKILTIILPESVYDLSRNIYNSLKHTYIDQQTKKFLGHNERVWKDYSINDPEAEVLVELTAMQPNIISNTYIANILAKTHNAKIIAYSFGENNHIYPITRKVYKSFNATVLAYSLNQEQLEKLEELFNDIYPSLKKKKDVFNLTISNLWIGDLINDDHLKFHNVPTVEISDDRFKHSLRKALYQYIYWCDYFDNHNVKGVVVSHCCYLMAIPLRVAIQRDIAAYQGNAHGCYRMNEERLWAYTDFYDYHTQFILLDKDIQREGLREAQNRIQRRFSGEVGVDMHYSTKSAYTLEKIQKVLIDSNQIKVLIAMHCFFDSPNGLGRNLFIDFYEWLTFLGNISEKTDYEWYIKTHPDTIPENIPILEEFVQKYPRFSMIPKETSHHQLIEEGIDYALTVYGTIAFEYAALNKTVINASRANPHMAYNFNIHPKTIEEYEEILLNLSKQDLYIDKNEVYEYYYMKHIKKNMENWLFDDYYLFIDEIGGYINQFSSLTYKYFLDKYSEDKHYGRLKKLGNFIDSGDYCMSQEALISTGLDLPFEIKEYYKSEGLGEYVM